MTKQVLIVEDEGIIAADIEECLVRKGFHIAGVADSGIKAIEIAQGTTPDVVLMDVKLTGSMDGIQAAIKMRSASAKIHACCFCYRSAGGCFSTSNDAGSLCLFAQAIFRRRIAQGPGTSFNPARRTFVGSPFLIRINVQIQFIGKASAQPSFPISTVRVPGI